MLVYHPHGQLPHVDQGRPDVIERLEATSEPAYRPIPDLQLEEAPGRARGDRNAENGYGVGVVYVGVGYKVWVWVWE